MSCIYVTVDFSVDSQLNPHYVLVCIGLIKWLFTYINSAQLRENLTYQNLMAYLDII